MIQNYSLFFGIVIVVALICYLFVKKKLLTPGAAISVVIMAAWLVMLMKPIVLVLPFLFLLLGSLAGRINKDVLFKSERRGRTAFQVFANGGCAMLIAIPFHLTYDQCYLIIYAVIFATALSDTLSGEIGRYFKGKTIDMRTLQLVTPGMSGGVSLKGTVAGLIGAVIISISAGLIFNFKFDVILIISILGFLGMLLDSVFGAYFQAKYMIHGLLSEEGSKHQLVHGYHWIDNSMVNFLTSFAISILAYILL